MRDIPALDGMRGVAALLVVGFHVIVYAVGLGPDGTDARPLTEPFNLYWLHWGFIGVDFFFVLSAFLLSQPFLDKGLHVDLRGYAWKRLLRVVPPYYASLLVGYALVGYTGHPWFEMDWHQTWTHLAFAHGFYDDAQFNVSPVYWTLAIELQFYLVLPLMAMAFRGRWWPVALAAAGAITLAYRELVVAQGDTDLWRFRESQLPSYLWHFALGITAARIRHEVRDRVRDPRWIDAGILAGVLVFIVLPSALQSDEETVFGVLSHTMLLTYRPLVAVGFTIVILGACTGHGVVARFMESRPLRRLGDWSYSLYLVHYPIGACIVLNVPGILDRSLPEQAFVLTMAGIVGAALFHAAVEAPVLRLKDRLRTRRGVPEATLPA